MSEHIPQPNDEQQSYPFHYDHIVAAHVGYQSTPPYTVPPAKKPNGAKRFALFGVIALLILIVIGLFFAGISFMQQVNTQYPPTHTATTSPQKALTVGQSALVGGWETTLQTVAVTRGDPQIDTPQLKAGETFLLINVKTINTSSTAKNLSSELSYSVRDEKGQQYIETIISTQKVAPDGLIQPHQVVSGDIVYKVPRTMHRFTMTFQPDILQQTSGATWEFQIQ